MADIEKIVDNLNLPKQLLDKSEAVLKTLFAQSFEEAGQLIADQVRLRRLKNQVKIFLRAQDILKKNGISPQRVSLKVLAPLIEYSSYEEEENLQEKWSYLTAHILEDNSDVIFQQNCITILNRLSNEDAKLIDNLYDDLSKQRKEKYEKELIKEDEMREAYKKMGEEYKARTKQPHEHPLEYFLFEIFQLSKKLDISLEKLEFRISNLTTLGILKWETDVEVRAETSGHYIDARPHIDVDVGVYNNDKFIFTPIGAKFVEVCSEKNIKENKRA